MRYGDGVAHFPTDGGGNLVDHNQFSTERSLAAALEASRSVGRIGSLHLEGFAARNNQGYTNRQDSPADTVGFAFIDDRRGVTWRRGVDGRFDWRFRAATLVSVGVGTEHENDDEHGAGVSNFGFGTAHDTTNFHARRTTHDAYAQLLSDPVTAVSLQAGLRIDHNSAFGDFATWRVGAAWHLTATTRIWAAAGTAFKAPTFPQSSVAFRLGSALIRRPGSSGGATASYRWNGLTVAATVTRVGSRDDVDFSEGGATRVILGGYTTTDLALDAPIRRAAGRSPGIEVTLRGENLFNAAYQQTVGFPGRGRTLFAGGRLRY